jgi:tRNA 5-methylaminomethyl-2-thiouridine biosynthesis bifunctional protein
MLQQSKALLQDGVDWNPCGVLERRPEQNLGLPAGWEQSPGADWSQAASAPTLQAAGLAQDTPACWHAKAGWVQPARLVRALLAQPGIAWCPRKSVARLQRSPATDSAATGDSTATGIWQALDDHGHTIAEAECVVLTAGPACNALLAASSAPTLPLQSVRGQLSWGVQDAGAAALPPFPVNGNGGLVAHVPRDAGLAWHMGSTFERDVDALPLTSAEVAAAHATNWRRLQELLPNAAPTLQAAFASTSPSDSAAVRAWASVRCTATDRLPIVGPVDAQSLPGLWVCTAMGARGLTRAVLCGELLAALVNAEPLPVDARLARAMGTERLEK